MKFDMGRAWNEATNLLSANRSLLVVVAGVFFFLPYAALMMFLPQQMAALQAPTSGNPEAMSEALLSIYASIWWVFLLIGLVQAVGMLALLYLLSDRARPTLGEALKHGFKYLLTYIGAQILQGILFLVLILIPFVAAHAGAVTVAVILGILILVAFVYLFTKLSLSIPVIAIESQGNPLTALTRSWSLTKGNSLRIFLFYLLLFIAMLVISAVFSFIVGIVFAIGGGQIAMIGNGLSSGLINAVMVTVFAAVLAAVYRQLAGPSAQAVSEAFE